MAESAFKRPMFIFHISLQLVLLESGIVGSSNEIHWQQPQRSMVLKWKALSYPFNNISLSWKERVDDLVGRLTIDEITLQMANGGRTTNAPGIERLGIPPYPWGSECLRGDVEAGPATSFPQALRLAAAFR